MNNNLDALRHSCAHLLASAVMNLYPHTKHTLGPAIENGFYYDFEFEKPISESDLPKIEQKMHEIVKSWTGFTSAKITINDALNEFKGNEYKLELIKEIIDKKESITLYTSGNFTDLCRGGHIENPKENLKHFKLLSIAGAYWRGSEKNKMLTRIYGTIFPTKKELDDYLIMIEEAKKRDHRKLNETLQLYVISEDVGPGLILWTPKGTIIKDELENWAKETEKKWGYQRVSTPHIGKDTLYLTSGHLPYYKDDMYSPMIIDEHEYYLKGMNCPHHHILYKSQQHSYRDFPIRFAEYGTCYRYEDSGTLMGLLRVRSIQMNDAHIYCRLDQAEEEFLKVLQLHEYYYNTLGLTRNDYHIVIGLKDESKIGKYHGDKKLWDKAETMMRSAIKRSGITCVDDIGGAAFYGPKIDFNITSSIGREFSISTNQLDLFMPERFDLHYIDEKGDKTLCAVIHRAPLGSHERFIGFLIEHYAGAFPLWLSPVQVVILPVSDKLTKHAQKVYEYLKTEGIRVELDINNKTLSAKIREWTLQKTPYICIIGEKEIKDTSTMFVSVRGRSGNDMGMIKVTDFCETLKQDIEKKT